MATPIVKVKKGRAEHSFYNLTQYEEWRADRCGIGMVCQVLQGLGTSTTAEAKEYFKQMKSTDFVTDDKSTDAMDLAFNKKRADDRKSWLKQYDRTKVLRDDRPQLTHRDLSTTNSFTSATTIRTTLPSAMTVPSQ
jgi:DNA topoisomerase-2